MSSRGPAPTPQSLRKLYGVPSSAPAVQPPLVDVQPPADLVGGARRLWDALAPDLIRQNVVDVWSAGPFARLCWLWSKSAELRAEIDASGTLVQGARNKEPVRNPLWSALRLVDNELLSLESRFGLSPADRSRLHVEPGGPRDGEPDPARLLT